MAGSSGRPAMASVEGGDEGAGEHEHDRRAVDEHDERDEDAERTVDLVVRPDLLDVEPEELLGGLPEHAREHRARPRRARSRAPTRAEPSPDAEHARREREG